MNNDLISREALKEAIRKRLGISSLEYLTEQEKVIVEEINNAPSVEPFEPDYVGAERLKARQRGYEEGYHYGMKIGKTLNPKIKQGEWINTSPYDANGECSLCCYLSNKHYNYCPNCGARMVSSENN